MYVPFPCSIHFLTYPLPLRKLKWKLPLQQEWKLRGYYNIVLFYDLLFHHILMFNLNGPMHNILMHYGHSIWSSDGGLQPLPATRGAPPTSTKCSKWRVNHSFLLSPTFLIFNAVLCGRKKEWWRTGPTAGYLD